MRRRLAAAVACTAVAVVAAAAGTAEPAQAFSGPNPVTLDANWNKVWQTVVSPTPAVEGSAGSATSGARLALLRGRVAAGSFPLLRGLGTLALGATAFQVGWKIGRVIDTQFLHLGPTTGGALGTNANSGSQQHGSTYYRIQPANWIWRTAGTSLGGGTIPSDGFYFSWKECSSASAGCTPTSTSYSYTKSWSPGPPPIKTLVEASVTVGTEVQSSTLADVWYRKATEDEIAVAAPPDASEPWTSQPTSVSTTGHVVPANPGASSGTATAVRDALLSGDDATDEEIGLLIDPTWGGENTDPAPSIDVGTLTLPQPEADETAIEYRARLRALGWLGSFSIVDYADTLPTLSGTQVWQDGDPVRLKLGTVSSPRLTIPMEDAWPGDPNGSAANEPAPRLQLDEDVTWEKVPDGTATRTGTDTPPAGLADGPGTGSCEPWLETTFSLAPLLDLDLGESFPFGVPAWMLDQVDALVTPADAPAYSIEVPSVGTDYSIDLEPFDPYMSTMRTVMSWLLWLGTVWYVGTSVLGFRGTGNPADAVDDYIDQVIP